MNLYMSIVVCLSLLCILVQGALIYSLRNQIKNIFIKISDVETALDNNNTSIDSVKKTPAKTKEPIRHTPRGEYLVSQYFNEIIKEHFYNSNFNIFHDVVFCINNGSDQAATRQIDHLLVCPYGIYIFETKNWNGITCFGLNKENFFLIKHLENVLASSRSKNGFLNIVNSHIDKPHGITLNFSFSSNEDGELMSMKHYNDPIEQINTTAYHFEIFLNKFNKNDKFPPITVNKVILMKTAYKEDVLVFEKDSSIHYLPMDSKSDLLRFFIDNIKQKETVLLNRTPFFCSLITSHTSIAAPKIVK